MSVLFACENSVYKCMCTNILHSHTYAYVHMCLCYFINAYRKEDQFAAKLRGDDGPLVHRYYSELHKSHPRPRVPQSYLTIPLPPGVKPGATAMRLSIPSADNQPIDQRKKFITLLPDGTGAI